MTARTILVHMFSEEETLEVQVSATSLFNFTAGAVKQTAAQLLKLKPRSLKIFGLFKGPLGTPKALLSDNDVLSASLSRVSLQRLSFDKESELSVVRDDERALQLLFGELKFEYNHFRVLPILSFAEMNLLDRLLANESLLQSGNKMEKQNEFFKIICDIPLYYWEYYYRAEHCILLNSTLPSSSPVELGMKLHVVISANCLILLEPAAVNGQELITLPWNKVSSVRVQKSPRTLIKFETFVASKAEDGDENKLIMISLETDRSEFLYTLTRHIFKMHEDRMSKGFLTPPTPTTMAKAEMNPDKQFCCFNTLFSRTI